MRVMTTSLKTAQFQSFVMISRVEDDGKEKINSIMAHHF